ncbi:uncharacterized protein K452DRAFT_63926 [Aplosporella prunicola CBS 121167]|uniref:Uncharacterized protein n=1 Tax=Aplosporella prunicola CBS 121167 TaxID=1176127 RepID=A0A6A6B712_9PEZI|nr:uncharacterized protein K452DRAFT_63926 [Aplosporella prunicola CBS 121167]KAF2139676.1 hypothetical protein K452DRAFT_63926 [Aplosporella prunicola CBS 121167]
MLLQMCVSVYRCIAVPCIHPSILPSAPMRTHIDSAILYSSSWHLQQQCAWRESVGHRESIRESVSHRVKQRVSPRVRQFSQARSTAARAHGTPTNHPPLSLSRISRYEAGWWSEPGRGRRDRHAWAWGLGGWVGDRNIALLDEKCFCLVLLVLVIIIIIIIFIIIFILFYLLLISPS